MHFFWPSLRCKVIEQMVKSRYLVEFPAQKKEPKWFQNLGRFKKNSSCSVAKKSPKNWTGPCLSLNMVRRKRFIKWQTPSRNAKSSFQGANPTPPSPMQQWRPPARTTIVSRTVGQHLFDTMCPTAFLAPTLTAKTCLSALSHKMHFFWPFFFLHCRTSARLGRSTTGVSLRLKTNFPKENQQPTQQTNNKNNPHTQAKARARQNSQGNLQTK